MEKFIESGYKYSANKQVATYGDEKHILYEYVADTEKFTITTYKTVNGELYSVTTEQFQGANQDVILRRVTNAMINIWPLSIWDKWDKV